MKRNKLLRPWLALLLATVLAFPVIIPGGVSDAASNQPNSDAADYFGSRFPALAGQEHVFDTLTYYELDYLLRNAGTAADDHYIILFGGSWQPETQAAIGYINEVAQAYGITSIRVFDTKLAGPELEFDIADPDSSYGESFTRRYVDLGARYLTNLNDHTAGKSGTLSAEYTSTAINETEQISPPGGEGTKTVNIAEAPFLFIYNKGNIDSPIVASLEGLDTAGGLEGLQSGSGVNDYIAALQKLFDQISDTGSDNVKRARHKVLSNLEYIPGSYNEFKSSPRNPEDPIAPDIFTAEDPPAVIDSVTLDELKHVLSQDQAAVVFIGCAWCGDSQGIVKYLNQVANEYGVEKVYNWDFKLDGGVGGLTSYTIPRNPRYAWGETLNGNALHTRTNNVAITHIFTDLVNTYLPNLVSQDTNRNNRITGINPVTNAEVSSSRLQAPYIFVYDKRNYDEHSNWAPVLGHVELMGYWRDTHHNENARSLRLNSLRTLFSRLEWKPEGLQASSISTADGKGQITGIANKALEYRLKGTSEYIAVPDNSNTIDTLERGVYEVRYASKPGFDTSNNNDGTAVARPYPASEPVHVYISGYQEAAPPDESKLRVEPATSLDNNDGKIFGLKAVHEQQPQYSLEYRKDGGEFAPVPENALANDIWSGLEAGVYEIRYGAYKAGNSSLNPSLAVSLTVKGHVAAPAGLQGIAPTSSLQNNGKIIGVSTDQEYRPANAASYIPVTGNEIIELSPGNYFVRYKATAATLASEATAVTVPQYYPSTGNGGGGGSGSNNTGNGNSNSEPADGITVTDNGARAEITAKADAESGLSIAFLNDKAVAGLLEQAKKVELAGRKATLEIKIEEAERTDSIQVTIPRDAFNKLVSGSNADVVVSTSFVAVTFDAVALKSIGASEDKGDISLILIQSELTEEGKQVLGDRPVYDVLAYAGETTLRSLSGSQVLVSLPYTLKQDEDSNAIIVYHLTDEGELQIIKGQYEPDQGAVTFSTADFSQYIIGYNKIDFEDVKPDAWYASAISYLAARDLANGTGDNRFSPNSSITRGQFLVLLLNAYGIAPEEASANNFADAGNTYYTGYLAAAKRLGIANGFEDNRFAPESSISRQDLFTLLYRALTVLDELPESQTGTAALSDFTDASTISGYAKDAIAHLVEAEVLAGANGKLLPHETTSRAQAAQVLYNLLSR